jgi:hypothetical protein
MTVGAAADCALGRKQPGLDRKKLNENGEENKDELYKACRNVGSAGGADSGRRGFVFS